MSYLSNFPIFNSCIPYASMFNCWAFQPMNNTPFFNFSGGFSTNELWSGDIFTKSTGNKNNTRKTNNNSDKSVKTTDTGGKTKCDKYFLKYCKEYGVDINLARAIRKAETGFLDNNKKRPPEKAVSPCGAQGLMQLMPATAREYGVSNAFDPEQNIKGGVKMLAELSKRFNGNIKLIAAAYNAGPNRECLKRGEIPNIPETQKYVKNVSQYYEEFKTMG